MKISITRLLLHNRAQRRPIGISVLLRRLKISITRLLLHNRAAGSPIRIRVFFLSGPIGVWRYIGVWHCVGVRHSIGVWYSIGTERLFLDGGYQLRL